jgi:hypothetical protein
MLVALQEAAPLFAPSWLIAVIAAGLGFGLGALLMSRLRVRREQVQGRARNARGRRGEERAAKLLVAAGYTIVARQQRASYALVSDSAPLEVGLSFDFVVSKGGRQWVAEVKTGALGTQLKHADTRRQLLEYQLASGETQVLLVDPERERISQVSFPLGALGPLGSAAAPAPRKLRVLAVFAGLLLVCTLILHLLTH